MDKSTVQKMVAVIGIFSMMSIGRGNASLIEQASTVRQASLEDSSTAADTLSGALGVEKPKVVAAQQRKRAKVVPFPAQVERAAASLGQAVTLDPVVASKVVDAIASAQTVNEKRTPSEQRKANTASRALFQVPATQEGTAGLMLGPELAFDEGILAAAPDLFALGPVAVVYTNQGQLELIEQAKAQLPQDQQILAAPTAKLAAEALKKQFGDKIKEIKYIGLEGATVVDAIAKVTNSVVVFTRGQLKAWVDSTGYSNAVEAMRAAAEAIAQSA